MKLVIDTNVVISAYITRGKVAREWRGRLARHSLIVSPEIMAEVERTLRRREMRLSAATVTAILRDVLARCEVVRPRARYEGSLPDEQDRHLANLGIEVNADGIITADRAILQLGCIDRIPVWSLNGFLRSVPSPPSPDVVQESASLV